MTALLPGRTRIARFAIAMLGVALLACASPVFASMRVADAVDESQGAPSLSSPGDVRAGEFVDLRWSRATADVEEVEVLLSLDGGRHYDLRVTPELDPRRGEWRWRVPNVTTSEARLRVRFGTRRGERFGPATTAFAITGILGRPMERRQVHEGGWWDGVDAFESAGACAQLGSNGPSWRDGSEPRAAALPPRAPILSASLASPTPQSVSASTGEAIARLASPTAPRFMPLRI